MNFESTQLSAILACTPPLSLKNLKSNLELTTTANSPETAYKTSTLTTTPTQTTIQNNRVIKTLPLPSIIDYTPYNLSDFDPLVIDLCKSKSNLSASKYLNDEQIHNNVQQQKQQAFTNPFAKCAKDHQSINQQQYTCKQVITKSCKVILSGDVAVGKTSLVNRFGCDSYSTAYNTTIGVDFDLQKFDILGQTFILQLWDTAGLERFKCITTSYYRGSQVALLVFDVSNLDSLASIVRWKNEIIESSKLQNKQPTSFNINGDDKFKPPPRYSAQREHGEPLLFLVGTKNDLVLSKSHRTFVREQANKLARLLQAELWFVSSRTGENVNALFNRVAALAFNQCVLDNIQQYRFETSTLGACLKETFLLQQKEIWNQTNKFIKITKKKEGDDRRAKCINIKCVIK